MRLQLGHPHDEGEIDVVTPKELEDRLERLIADIKAWHHLETDTRLASFFGPYKELKEQVETLLKRHSPDATGHVTLAGAVYDSLIEKAAKWDELNATALLDSRFRGMDALTELVRERHEMRKDAEVGRLLRQIKGDILLQEWEGRWSMVSSSMWYDTPEEALRAALEAK